MGHSYKVRSTRIASAKLHLKFSHGCSSEKENLGLTIQAAFSPGAVDTVDSTCFAFCCLKVRKKII